jgi:hypothetical protein
VVHSSTQFAQPCIVLRRARKAPGAASPCKRLAACFATPRTSARPTGRSHGAAQRTRPMPPFLTRAAAAPARRSRRRSRA